jgi:cobalt-zinc-cadmium efflux system membrane fusion protein
MKNLNISVLKNLIRLHSIYLISTVLISCGTENTETTKTKESVNQNLVTLTEAQFKNAAIKTGIAETRTVSDILKLNGSIEVPPQNLISISIPLGGYLKSTTMLPGTTVKKGQVIAIIEDPQYIQLQQDYLVTKAKLAYSEQEQYRQKELNKEKAGSDKALQLAEAEYKSMKIAIAAYAEKLRLIGIDPYRLSETNISRQIQIRSSINGYVSRVNGNIGSYFNPSDVLIELINPSDIHLTLTVFEKDLGKLSRGQKAITFSNNNPDKKYETEIGLISNNLSAERTAEVHCHFKQFDKSLIPGMYMNAEITVQDNREQTLPEKSIVNFEGKNYVFLEKATRTYEMTEVIIDGTENGFTAVKTDLGAKKIVTAGTYSLLMQLKNLAEE